MKCRACKEEITLSQGIGRRFRWQDATGEYLCPAMIQHGMDISNHAPPLSRFVIDNNNLHDDYDSEGYLITEKPIPFHEWVETVTQEQVEEN